MNTKLVSNKRKHCLDWRDVRVRLDSGRTDVPRTGERALRRRLVGQLGGRQTRNRIIFVRRDRTYAV